MSATARATTRPAGRPQAKPATAGRPRRTPLREVPPPAPAVAGTGVFSLVVVGVLVLGMVLLLVLNTSLAAGAFEISSLTSQQRSLAVTEQRLLQDVARAEAPESLQARARDLGMVPVASPVFLRLADGKVLGIPKAAQADPTRRIPTTGGSAATATKPEPQPSTKPSTTKTSTKPKPKPSGDAAVADPETVTDGAVPDAPTATSRGTR